MFNEIYDIKYNDVDMNGVIKPSVIFEFFEDVAAKNANFLNFGYDRIAGKNLAWFLIKYRIEFYKYPKNLNKLKVLTDPKGANKNFCYRNFYIEDENENILAKASSVWAIVDTTEKKILNPLETFPNCMNLYKKTDEDLKYEKILPINNVNYEKNFDTEYFDIDINKHVNNSKYISWALEILPVEFLQNKTIKTIDIIYKKEITLGQIAVSKVQVIDENTTLHTIINSKTNEDLTNILISWE